MSEVQSRPSTQRGRGSARGGRGGYGSRGGPRTGARQQQLNPPTDKTSTPSLPEDEGLLGELKHKYRYSISTLKELFPGWTDEDLVFALQETDNNLQITIERISEGTISQWGEVKKKTKERSRSKVQDPASLVTHNDSNNGSTRGRGARGAAEGGRGSRGGRGNDRGRGNPRGPRGNSAANGSSQSGHRKEPQDHVPDVFKAPVSTEDTPSWDNSASNSWDNSNTATGSAWDNSNTGASLDSSSFTSPPATTAEGAGDTATSAAKAEPSKDSLIKDGAKKSWASMFAKPTPAPAPKKPTPALVVPKAEIPVEAVSETQSDDPAPLSPPLLGNESPVLVEKTSLITPATSEPEESMIVTPSVDELTKSNLDQVLDESAPAPTATAASTIASSKDPRSTTANNTPYSVPKGPTARPPTSGYVASAFKAPGVGGRSSSFQRRVLDQQEAVVMPGNHAVDRAAVQFGSLGLNGASEELDVDEDREEAETRAQPPQHSPVAHPVASLPPAPQSQAYSQQPKDALPTPRQAPGLPAVAQQPLQSIGGMQQAPQVPLSAHSMAQQNSQQYSQLGRYGQQAAAAETAATAQKPYEAFGQQNPPIHSQHQFDGYPSQQPSTQAQTQQAQTAAYSSSQNEYASYYTSDHHQQRSGYPQNYYASPYGQPTGQGQQDAAATHARSSAGFAADNSSQYAASQAQQAPSRYAPAAEAQASGHSTPNPTSAPNQQPQQQPQTAQPQQSQHMQPQHPQAQTGGQYPYGHPYYSSPYYAAYMNQFGYNQNYGAPYGAKGAVYSQPHQYGMSPQAAYDSTTPANAGAFNQASTHGRDSALAPGMTEYGRSASNQASQAPQPQPTAGSAGFTGMSDVFGRGGSYQGQNQALGQQSSNPQGGNDDSLKTYGESKGNGPSPSMNQPLRPASATNASGGQPAQAGHQAQSQQGQPGYGNYPNHLNHQIHGSQGGQFGGIGGLGAHHTAGQNQHQAAAYGNYGAGFGTNYYGTGNRGGWGGNYGH
ncbi:MAG: hypothetical protein M1829_004698 [Trizodia sp. TS-e1964]|nr:MAG: hypothetical protein M1829_004698 [Trizodia sp. TS-e1964]